MKRTIWHLISEDGYEDYALSPEDRDALKLIYEKAGTSFTIEAFEEDVDDNDDEPLYEPF
jgi:hypothetical protein